MSDEPTTMTFELDLDPKQAGEEFRAWYAGRHGKDGGHKAIAHHIVSTLFSVELGSYVYLFIRSRFSSSYDQIATIRRTLVEGSKEQYVYTLDLSDGDIGLIHYFGSRAYADLGLLVQDVITYKIVRRR